LKSTRLAALASALVLAATLGACKQSAAPEAPEQADQAAAPDAKPGISLDGGELVLPVVAGRPGAAYFKVRNGGESPVSLVSAYVEGATSAEIHETAGGTMQKRDAIEIKPGETLDFAQGKLHVMVFEPADELTAGGTTELTLTFSDGDKVSAPIGIRAGGAMADMSEMDH
jgi:copper(I)-binding protein